MVCRLSKSVTHCHFLREPSIKSFTWRRRGYHTFQENLKSIMSITKGTHEKCSVQHLHNLWALDNNNNYHY